MDYLPRLKAAYRNHADIEVVSGLNPFHFANYRDAPFTQYIRNGKPLTIYLGISLWEILVFERICRASPPKSILIIGNGLGWSAIAMSMMNPDASVVVIEPEAGIELTNRIASVEHLNCKVVKGFSPQDNGHIIKEYCPCPPDFVLIDGMHTSEQIVRDFNGTFSVCGRTAIYLFHDVVNFDLFHGLSEIAKVGREHAMTTTLLLCTPSGMAAVVRDDAPQALSDTIGLFSAAPEAIVTVGQLSGRAVPDEWLAHSRTF